METGLLTVRGLVGAAADGLREGFHALELSGGRAFFLKKVLNGREAERDLSEIEGNV